MTRRAPVFEEAGYSLFGPMALNIAAPDKGNVHLLDQVASASQRGRYLAPLARGLVRSTFAMTEPAPGAGSDPSALRTTAARVGGMGVTRDLPAAKIAREIRPFRIYDGPSEVHRWSLARRAVREITGP
jgi:alkylation response protein AidB-like acyl-CoA dehydrogenase